MEAALIQMMISVQAAMLSSLLAPIRAATLKLIDFVFGKSTIGLAGILQHPMAAALTNIADTFCWVCFAFSLLFYFLKIAQEEQRNWLVIAQCPVKAIFFVLTYKYIVQICYLLPCYIISGFRYFPDLTELINDDFFEHLGDMTLGVFTAIVVIVAIIAFACITVLRIGTMMIQILSAPFYVPYVLLGDTQKMMEWVLQTVSVGFTFVIQYAMFYSGLVVLLYGGTDFLNFAAAMGLLFSTFSVPRQMQKFGWSSGSGQAFQAASSAGTMLISGARMLK